MDNFIGHFDYLGSKTIQGWAYNKSSPGEPVIVSIYIDEKKVTEVLSNEYREDIREYGIGNGNHSFSYCLPNGITINEKSKVEVYINGNEFLLPGNPEFTVEDPNQSSAANIEENSAFKLQGSFDEASDKIISGWAFNQNNPQAPCAVDVFIDDIFFKTISADNFREDLKQSGIGSGKHGFNFILSLKYNDGKHHTVDIRFSNTNKHLPGSPKSYSYSSHTPESYLYQINKLIENYTKKFDDIKNILIDNGDINLVKKGTESFEKYKAWLENNFYLNDSTRLSYLKKIIKMEKKPLISIVMPTYNTNPQHLRKAIDSVLGQLYPNWELCMADDASTKKETLSIIKEYVDQHQNIKCVFKKTNDHIARTTNRALKTVSGDYILFMDHDDELTEDALYRVAKCINENENAEIIYSDEDKIDDRGNLFDPHFKPSYNYTYLLSCNYISHLTVVKRELRDKTGWLNEKLNGSQDYDFILRLVENSSPENIFHIPYVLYHWRTHTESTSLIAESKPYTVDAGITALQNHLERMNYSALAEKTLFGQYRVKWSLKNKKPLVSIVIPTRDCAPILALCIHSILEITKYNNYEIIIVDNQSQKEETKELFNELEKSPNIKIVKYDAPFNYAAIMNFGVQYAKGEYLLLLNNDIEAIEPEWLHEMLSQAMREQVGAVGTMLLYPNDLVQHGGVILGIGGVAGHAHKHSHKSDLGYFFRLQSAQELSACTAASLLVPTKVFNEINGFDAENLAVAFNDIDLCLRIREQGYKIVYTPYAVMRHHESYSRGEEDTPAKIIRFNKEVRYMKQRWNALLENDPYYNPNLTKEHEDFSIGN